MILVTGGCGYIGSHFIVKIIEMGLDVVSIDNFSNSDSNTVDNIKKITGSNIDFIEGDVRDKTILDKIFANYNIKSVVHFAGHKSIPESIENPLEYYSCNVSGSLALLVAMLQAGTKEIIFSSSASVYGNNHPLPWHEDLDLSLPLNPYAQSKFITERMLQNISNIDSDIKIGILRYFNPVGYHLSGLIGDNINKRESNLIPSITRVLLGIETRLSIFGNNYNTKDGTGVRDYIHIDDLIDGHIAALKHINVFNGFNIWNLGTGWGCSVLQIIDEFENQLDQKIPYIIKDRRKGDLPEYWSAVLKAKKELNWSAVKNLQEMVKSTICRVKHLEDIL